MFSLLRQKRRRYPLGCFLIISFLCCFVCSGQVNVYAQEALNLPEPGSFVPVSSSYTPALISGMTLSSEDPLKFNFIIDVGDDFLEGEALKKESKKLIGYFMATLTVPEEEMWVNLSPYEKDRIIANGLGQTVMGRDMLAQDYILKQLTASMMYPESKLGNQFWERVYQKAQEKFGTTEIPTNTFNKIWIVPESAEIYANGLSVFVADSRLKVMLEEDYLALAHHDKGLDTYSEKADMMEESKEILKEVLLPEIEKEVNEGKNFATLRQMYHSMILATWYKNNFQEGLLGQIYVDQNKVSGVDVKDKEVKNKIYNQYLAAFKKGVYDYIKEDYDAVTQTIIPRKYFSGGLGFSKIQSASTPVAAINPNHAISARSLIPKVNVEARIDLNVSSGNISDFSMATASLPMDTEVEEKVLSLFGEWNKNSVLKELGVTDLAQELKGKSFYYHLRPDQSSPTALMLGDNLVFNISLADNNPLVLSIQLFKSAFESYLDSGDLSASEKFQKVEAAVKEFSFNLFINTLQSEEDLLLAYKAAYYLESLGEDAVDALVNFVEDENMDGFTRIHAALALWKIQSDNARAKEVLKNYRDKHAIFSEAVKLLEDYNAVDEVAEKAKSQPQKGMYITLVSLHGLIKDNQQLGIDPDTGGQVLYVLELAKALGKLENVDRVDLITRLMPDFEGSDTPEYSQETEVLSEADNVYIKRISFSGNTYLPKEQLWGGMSEFTDNLMNFFEKQGRYPNIMWTHYADAGYAGALLSKKLNNTEMLHTVHSLGLPKLINTTKRSTFDQANEDIHIFTRILAEEVHFSAPITEITNSQQEVLEQVGLYANSQLNKAQSNPPGVNLEEYKYDVEPDDPRMSDRIRMRAFLDEATKKQLSEERQGLAPIGLFARFDEKKNWYGMIKSFGMNKELQSRANLYLGFAKEVETLEGKDLEIYNNIKQLINEYNLEGKIVYIANSATYIPEVYKFLVDHKGVFVNLAFTEPFGLMVLEARGVGVPVVATNNGGPNESIHDGVDGILVDVTDPVAVGAALNKVLSDDNLWEQFSTQGLADVQRRYTWDQTAQRGMDIAKKVEVQRINQMIQSIGEAVRGEKTMEPGAVDTIRADFNELIGRYDLATQLEIIGSLMENNLLNDKSLKEMKGLGFVSDERLAILDHIIFVGQVVKALLPQVVEDIKKGEGLVRLGIVGESGTGKTISALLLKRQLERMGYSIGILHLDNYFKLLPKANALRRRLDFNKWVGPQEVDLKLLEEHMRLAKEGKPFLRPVSLAGDRLDVDESQRITESFDPTQYDLVIAEGTYVGRISKELDRLLFYKMRYDDPSLMERKTERDTRRGETSTPQELKRIREIEHQYIAQAEAKATWVVDGRMSLINKVDGSLLPLNEDYASTSTLDKKKYGGIDFNAENMNLNVQGKVLDMDFSSLLEIDPDIVGRISPVIINITPVMDFPLLLEFSAQREKDSLGLISN